MKNAKRFRIQCDSHSEYFDSFVLAAEQARHLVRSGAAEVAVEEQCGDAWNLRDRYLTAGTGKD